MPLNQKPDRRSAIRYSESNIAPSTWDDDIVLVQTTQNHISLNSNNKQLVKGTKSVTTSNKKHQSNQKIIGLMKDAYRIPAKNKIISSTAQHSR